ncbi:chorismate-binding protein [Lachnobacterium bovis]|uniref:chorismate-binding protein n=1 Tax=Lachnobacterium bovis TaxID=140626 RepID=UPI000480ABB9|nr:chorismate-binding protein [Lachnobacterium bovis]
MKKILLIDNYDSFTFNVYQYLRELQYDVICVRNDKITLEEIEQMDLGAIFISPGPGNPQSAGICLEVVKKFAGEIPMFGICLGHQIIGEAFGGKVIHANQLFHGKTSKIISKGLGVFSDFPSEFIATRYHSLIVEKDSLPDCFEVTCETEDGEIMGIVHKEYEIEGVQFHPESIMTQSGLKMLENFLNRINLKKETVGTHNQNTICYEALKEIHELGIKQYAKKESLKTDFINVFKALRKRFGTESCCLFDSVKGPEIDCGNSYIGLFPELEIIVDNHKMKILSDSKYLKEKFEINFREIFDNERQEYNLGERCFSDIFLIISAMFKEEKVHDFESNFTNGLMGVFSYEYLHYIEKIADKNKRVLNFPDIHLKYYSHIIEYNPKNNEILIINNILPTQKYKDIDIIQIVNDYLKESNNENAVETGKIEFLHSNIEEREYYQKVKKAKEYIKDGDIFQIQLGRRLHIKQKINPFSIYEKLRAVNPSPYMFYWEDKAYQLISNSPELQLRVENGNVIIRPIAGTSKGKGKSKVEAEFLRKDLENNPKEQAEHIMLVDLARNDIGRVADAGSVKVTTLMKSEEFSHVFHLISSVEGKVSKNINTMKLFESTFPAGTLTGAPKVRAMEIINELENEERGPYGGATGFFEFNGNIVSSITIRTILRKEDDLYLHASAGIVADSKDYLEWQEIQHKTEAIKQVLIEEK